MAPDSTAPDRRLATPRLVTDPRTPAAYSFVVRLWKETRESVREEPIWRGTVSDLSGRALGSFSSATELAGILGRMSDFNVLLRFSCEAMAPSSPEAP